MPLSVPDASTLVLGLDVGGTKTAILLGTGDARVLDRVQFPSRAAEGFDAMFGEICRHTGEMLSRHPGVEAIGVSIGGPLDAEQGLVLGPPNLPGWDRVPLRELLRGRFKLPVGIEHDAKAGALAEWKYGAGRGARDLVFLTLGTGLGAGIISGGRLVRGAGNAAGEVGHWRIADDGPLVYGKRGSWEGYSSGTGIAALGRDRYPARFGADVGAAQIAEQARAGQPEALEIVAAAAEKLGRGIALLVDALAPEVVVLGSLAQRMGDLLLPAVHEVVRREALPALARRCRVVPGELGDRLQDLAALCAALHGELR